MKILGITGGVGSGKSAVLDYLEEEYGAAVCKLDEEAKLLQRRGTDCFDRIVREFGEEMVGADGELDRGKLAEEVFGDRERLERLNGIVHPEVKRRVEKEISTQKGAGTTLFVIEAALLLEAGYETVCDEIWYIYVREDVRRERLSISRGYSDEKISQMMRSQRTEEDFRKGCTRTIDNSGTFENTKRQIGEIL